MAKKIVTDKKAFSPVNGMNYEGHFFSVNAGVDADAAWELSDLLHNCSKQLVIELVDSQVAEGDKAWVVGFMLDAARALSEAAFQAVSMADARASADAA